jgi:hypothetical protein
MFKYYLFLKFMVESPPPLNRYTGAGAGAGAEFFSLHHRVQIGSEGQPASQQMVTGGLFYFGIKVAVE